MMLLLYLIIHQVLVFLCLVNSDLAGVHINRTVGAGLTSSVG